MIFRACVVIGRRPVARCHGLEEAIEAMASSGAVVVIRRIYATSAAAVAVGL